MSTRNVPEACAQVFGLIFWNFQNFGIFLVKQLCRIVFRRKIFNIEKFCRSFMQLIKAEWFEKYFVLFLRFESILLISGNQWKRGLRRNTKRTKITRNFCCFVFPHFFWYLFLFARKSHLKITFRMGAIPIVLCLELATFLGSGLIFAAGVVYGFMALGKKADLSGGATDPAWNANVSQPPSSFGNPSVA